ncbi:5-methyltetrahydropteroyltriglutamate--homocysteine S-methyltransferase [Companilactobacillus nantensis]|uniref:Methionine synthase n=1 Tax=Companilactobacillus nantensis DSM 16982 TaxID=1423774 RepID=A0A0R1WAE3_9LACO|nr:5-methyltetrahydropteroyltriglutamate--homocysteine S-methyltransferase [Companilactobacillus nantensis]KRM14607.1 methionine synthase [Companilactobacillus nantensis DSM 16982]GEO65110.1 5-methyltetrahydropteroyltriglutamate--homocysteine methyltransferase [Companilactobacillus nantensis]
MTTTNTTTKIGFQHVGSFLRPAALKQARADFESGKINHDDLRKVENDAIEELINQQKDAGLDYATDGEFRRSYWHLDFFWGFEGVKHTHIGEGYDFSNGRSRDDTAVLTDKISFNADTHPFIQDFKFTKSITDKIGGILPKQTIPAPAQLYRELTRGKNLDALNRIYPDKQEFYNDVEKAYHDAILAFYNEGARVIQLDDCSWGRLLDKKFLATEEGKKLVAENVQDIYLELNNGAIADLPDDLTINTHICRGNFHSSFLFSGGYDNVADNLFGQENVDTYFLEYDSDRAGSFAPLAKVSGDKKVVLGLITSKDGKLENRQDIIDRIHEASQYLPLDRLWLSTQCGFASTEEGNVITPEQQWEKLALVKSIIDEVWGK